MTPDDCILNIKAQLQAYECGDITVIGCPYCGKINMPGSDFCCELFAKASIAALERMRVEQSTEVVQRITERHLVN